MRYILYNFSFLFYTYYYFYINKKVIYNNQNKYA